MWHRESYITKGPDPTVVVEWSNGGTTITEFQGVYVEFHGVNQVNDSKTLNFAEELHRSLEREWELQNDLNDLDREYRETAIVDLGEGIRGFDYVS
jgi:hypothetical protein